MNAAFAVEEESVPVAGGGVLGNNENDMLSYRHTGSVNWPTGSGIVSTVLIGSESFDAGQVVYFDQTGQLLGNNSTGAAAQLVVNDDGSYEFEVIGNMLHAPVQGENELRIPLIRIQGEDADGGSVVLNLTVDVIDDVPVISTRTPDFAGLLVDDSFLDIDDTAQIGRAVFIVNFGADGGAAQEEKFFELLLKGGELLDSGLDDTALASQGQVADVMLKKDGANVVGVVNVNGHEVKVFTLSIDSTTGEVTLDQHRAVVHGSPADPDEITSVLANVIDLRFTATDGDGDRVSASIDIGKMLFFADDGPLARNDSDSTEWVLGKIVATGNVVSGFGTTNNGQDQHEGMHDGARAEVLEVRPGAEGSSWSPGTALQGGSATIQGQYGALNMDSAGNYTYAFTGSGPVTADLKNSANGFNFGTSFTTGLGEVLQLSAADGTVTTQSAGLGVNGLTNDTANAISAQIGFSPSKGTEALSIDIGAEAVRAVVDISNLYQNESKGQGASPGLGGALNDGETGRWEAFDANGNKVGEGMIGGALFMNDAAGSGLSEHQGKVEIEVLGADGKPLAFQTIVFTAVDYLKGTSSSDSSDYFVKAISYEKYVDSVQDTFSYLMRDGDGDQDSATLTIGAGHELGDGLVIVHEDALGVVGNLDSAVQTTSGSGGLNMGAATYSLVAPVQKITSGGENVRWEVSRDGLTMLGKTGSGVQERTLVKVTIDKISGDYEVQLLGQVDHRYAVQTNGTIFGTGDGESELLYLQLIAAKRIGTTTEFQGFNIKIQDDAPVILAEAQSLLLANKALSGIGDLGVKIGADVVGAAVTIHGDAPAGQPVMVKYVDSAGHVQAAAMHVAGQTVRYVNDNGMIKGVYGNGKIAFTIQGKLNADGATAYEVKFEVKVDMVGDDSSPWTADQVWLDLHADIVDGDGDSLNTPVRFAVFLDNDNTLDASVALGALKLDDPDARPSGFVIVGSDADEVIIGTSGDDVIYGSDGDDYLEGGPGDDTMAGGDGRDTFAYNHGDLGDENNGDVIEDFEFGDAGDTMDLVHLLQDAATYDVEIEAGTDGQLVVNVDLDGSGGNQHQSTVIASVTPIGSGHGDDVIETMQTHINPEIP